jgi:hypothetical protein
MVAQLAIVKEQTLILENLSPKGASPHLKLADRRCEVCCIHVASTCGIKRTLSEFWRNTRHERRNTEGRDAEGRKSVNYLK